MPPKRNLQGKSRLRSDHVLGTDDLIEFVFRDESQIGGFLLEGRAVFMGGFRDLRRLVIADLRRQCGDQHERALHELVYAVQIGFDAYDAIVRKASARVADESDRLQQVMDHDRLEHVEFHVALAAGHGYGRVVAHDLTAHHCQRFALGRVDFAGHDRRARFILGQYQFAETRPGARAQKPHIVGDFEQAARQRIERARRFHDGVMTGERFKFVGSRFETQTGYGADMGREFFRESGFGIQAGPHGRAPLRQKAQPPAAVFYALDAVVEHGGVTGELLT